MRLQSRPSRRLTRIDFACNNPDNGYFEGRVRMIEVADWLELEGDIYGRGYAFAVDDKAKTIRLHRKTFRFVKWLGGGTSLGMGWAFELREAKRLLRHVKASGKWTCGGGLVRMCEWFD